MRRGSHSRRSRRGGHAANRPARAGTVTAGVTARGGHAVGIALAGRAEGMACSAFSLRRAEVSQD